MKHHACLLLLTLCLAAVPTFLHAGETVEIHGILEETTSGMILVTDASSYMVRGIDASGLDGRKAIVLGDQGEDNGLDYIDAMEIKIAQ